MKAILSLLALPIHLISLAIQLLVSLINVVFGGIIIVTTTGCLAVVVFAILFVLAIVNV